jgi:hypothetical protein
MRTRLLLAALLALAAFTAQAVAAPAAAPPNTRICGQIKGPHAKYLSAVSGFRSQGTTWTIIVTGVDCKYATKQTPGLLKQWAKAKIGAALKLAGESCIKMIDHGYSGQGTASGGFMCRKGSSPPISVFDQKTFAARETNPYTIAQIKALFGIK